MRFRQLISLIMLMLIISHGVFQFFVFKIFQAKYRQEMLEVIEDGRLENELILFTFRKDDLKIGGTKAQWVEENEFRFNDKMYDVVKTETRGDSVYLYCLHDENESRLYTILDEFFQQMLDGNPDKVDELITLNNSLSQFYSKPFDHENDTGLYEKGKYFTDVNSNLLEGEHFLVIPPPRS
jgi:hypothetical protein